MQNPSPEHQKLVQALINHFVNQLGYTVMSASYGNFEEPPAHGRHEPDIVAKDKTGLLHIAEAKIGDDIDTQRSKEQFLDFANRVMSNTAGNLAGSPVPFHIVVYKADEPKVMTVLNQLGLGAKVGNRITVWTL